MPSITWSNWQGPCAWQLYWKKWSVIVFLECLFLLCSLCMLTWSYKSAPVQQQWCIHSGILVEVGFGVKSDMRIKDWLPNLVWFLCSQYLSIYLSLNLSILLWTETHPKKNPMKMPFEESLVSTIWSGCQERMKNSKFLSSPLIDNVFSLSLSLLLLLSQNPFKTLQTFLPPIWSGCHQRLKNMSFLSSHPTDNFVFLSL